MQPWSFWKSQCNQIRNSSLTTIDVCKANSISMGCLSWPTTKQVEPHPRLDYGQS
jgi:hypothetical protein